MDAPSDHYDVFYRKDGVIDHRDDADEATITVKAPHPFKPFDRGMERTFHFKREKGKLPWKALDAAIELFEIGFNRGSTEKMRELRACLMVGETE